MGVSDNVVGCAVDVEVLEAADEAVAQRGRPQRGRDLHIGVHIVDAADEQTALEVELIRIACNHQEYLVDLERKGDQVFIRSWAKANTEVDRERESKGKESFNRSKTVKYS